MPHTVQSDKPIAGFTVKPMAPGESGLIQVFGFRTSDEGSVFARILEGCEPFLAGGPPIERSQIDHFLFVIDQTGKATVYVNELQTKAKIQVKGKNDGIKAGDPVMVDDIADIVEVDLGVEIPADAGVAYMFSYRWRKALFFDFRQIGPSPVLRTYNLPAVLAGCRCALMFSERFSLDDSEWLRLMDQRWFPFVGLSLATANDIILHVQQNWDFARLEPRIMQECKDLAPSFAASCKNATLFQPHAEAIAAAARHLVADEWFSAASILYPRIEGILRTYYASIGSANRPTQDRFLAAAHSGSGVGRHGYCLLLLDRFNEYLRQVIFAPFDQEKLAGVSRHTLAHGVVDPAECDGKSVAIAMLSLHHLFYSLTAGVKPTVKVFQFGSNCSESEINTDDRLRGDAKFIDIAQTDRDFDLAFDVYSKKRRCAASDIVESPGNKVWGVLYEIPEYLMSKATASAHGRKSFDEIEGPKYKRETIVVRRPNGAAIEAIIYRVAKPQTGLKTNLAYVGRIIAGLREHGIDAAYIARVKEIAATNNPDIAEGLKTL